MENIVPKVWNEAEIVNLLLNSDKAVERGVLAIYNRQATLKDNGVEFSGPDAKLGSYYARWIISGRNLSGKHLNNARKMMVKYRRQLTEIANTPKAG